MHLQGYSFKLINEPGSSNLADYLSRFPVSKPPSRNFAEKYLCHLTAHLLSVAIPESGVEYGSSEDQVICKVQHALRCYCGNKFMKGTLQIWVNAKVEFLKYLR